MILVTYDISIESPGGNKRLRKIHTICQKYGRWVQNSVFECIINNTELFQLQLEISELIDERYDTVVYYNLGNNYQNKVTRIGKENGIDQTGDLFF